MPSRCAPSRRVVSKTWKASPSGDNCSSSVRGTAALLCHVRYSWFRCRTGARDQAARAEVVSTPQLEASAASRSPTDGGLAGGAGLPGGQVEGHGGLDPAGGVRQAEMVEQQGDRQHGRGRVGRSGPGDVRSGAVHRLEHARVGAGDVQIGRCGQPDAAGDRGGQVGQDVAEQVVGHDDVETARVGDQVDHRGVDVRVRDRDLGELHRDLFDDPAPQLAGVHQHIGLVHQRQVPARPAGRSAERVPHHPLDAEVGVQRDLGGDLVHGVLAQQAAVSGVRALGALPQHQQVDGLVTGQRTDDARVEAGGTQVDVMVQFEPDAQQQATLENAGRHCRVADRAEQDRVVLAEFAKDRIGQ